MISDRRLSTHVFVYTLTQQRKVFGQADYIRWLRLLKSTRVMLTGRGAGQRLTSQKFQAEEKKKKKKT